MSNVQVLITTMNLNNPKNLLDKMNISSNFSIGNQTDKTEDKDIKYKSFNGKIYSRKEIGVGRNRNLLISNSIADYCIIADDDMRFDDNYEGVVLKYFNIYPQADVIIFNIKELKPTLRRLNNTTKKINIFNYLNYGAARIVFRRNSISYNGITFNTNFGGGTQHLFGEDTLFLRECLRKGLKIIAVPDSIATLLDDRESTWFSGYNEKFLFDKGVVLALAHPFFCKLFAMYLSIKHPEFRYDDIDILDVYKIIKKGINYANNRGFY